MNNIETMKLALEALEGFIPYLPLHDKEQCARYDQAITALRQAIKQAQKAEPVAWINGVGDLFKNPDDAKRGQTMRPLYTSPSHRQPLSDEEIKTIFKSNVKHDITDAFSFARAIEAAHSIKGTA